MILADLAGLLGGAVHGDSTLSFGRPLPPDEAGPDDLAVAMQPDLVALLPGSQARVGLLAEGAVPPQGALQGWVSIPRPRYALHRLTEAMGIPPFISPGIHPSAVIEAGAQIDPDVAIGPFVHVGPGARIGRGCRILSHVSIGCDAVIGEDCLIYSGARLGERVHIGSRVILHPNVCIGADGFSFVTPEPGSVEHAKSTGSGKVTAFNEHIARIHSLGAVTIGNDVEVGANTCIDRGTLTDTRIGHGTKIDDLVMIGHNVQIGMLCMICGHVGIAGSSEIGNGVVLAGGVGVSDHSKIGDHAVIGGRSAVTGEVPPREVWIGYPARPRKDAMETFVYQARLKEIFKDVANLKKQVAEKGRDPGCPTG